MNIYFMRHAKPELPHNGRIYYGATDYPLCREGIESAETVHEYLRDKITFDVLYTSDMIRSIETAKIIAPEMKPNVVRELREIDLGEWEGRTFDEVRSEFTELYERRGADFAHTAPPGGETFAELQERTTAAFEKIISSHTDGNILFVLHGAVIWTLFAHILGYDLNRCFYFAHDYCATHVFRTVPGGFKLIRYNWMPMI